jgi:hypothetical protein
MFFAFIKITTRILFGVVKKDWKRNKIVLPVLSFLLSKVRVNKPQTSPVITRCDFVAYGQGMQKTFQRFFM